MVNGRQLNSTRSPIKVRVPRIVSQRTLPLPSNPASFMTQNPKAPYLDRLAHVNSALHCTIRKSHLDGLYTLGILVQL